MYVWRTLARTFTLPSSVCSIIPMPILFADPSGSIFSISGGVKRPLILEIERTYQIQSQSFFSVQLRSVCIVTLDDSCAAIEMSQRKK